MRLFIAVNFTPEIKKALKIFSSELQTLSEKGNFTNFDNFHLTVVFLGEIKDNKIKTINKIIDNCFTENSILTLNGFGKFKGKNNDIYWIGIKENKVLENLYSNIVSALKNAGFEIHERKFKPHITIGREISVKKTIDIKIPMLSTEINTISLMKSERINGRIFYSVIYEKTIKRK